MQRAEPIVNLPGLVWVFGLSMDHGLVMVQLVSLPGDEVALIACQKESFASEQWAQQYRGQEARVCLGMLLSPVTDL